MISFHRAFADDRNNNDHRDITFPHGDNPGEGDGLDDDDVNGDNPEEDDSEVTQKKLTYNKKGKIVICE